jgi:hypothetical protein
MWYQNISLFCTDFKNLYFPTVKSAPKKDFAQKPDFFPSFDGKIVLWLIHFQKSV